MMPKAEIFHQIIKHLFRFCHSQQNKQILIIIEYLSKHFVKNLLFLLPPQNQAQGLLGLVYALP